MIRVIELENFKCFDHLRIELGCLTLLTGYNSGGKSTAIQPLLILAQRLRRNSHGRTFPLNGPLVQLGAVGDIVPAASNDTTIHFTVGNKAAQKTWSMLPKAGQRSLFGKSDDSEAGRTVVKELRRLTYLSAVRNGTPDSYPYPDSGGRTMRDVSPDGRFAAYEYDRAADDIVPLERRCPGEAGTTTRKQVDAWFSALFPGAQANVQSLPGISRLAMQFRLTNIGEWRRPANVGYGFTYAFPIIVTLLTAQPGQAVIIDSPEAHLHPEAQSKMGQLLAHFAAAGVQIVVETHSDHLLNGVRVALQRGLLDHKLLRVHFFTGAVAGDNGVKTLAVDAKGSIYDWPVGFFDQSEKDLYYLSGAD